MGLGLVTSVIVARVLGPADYGAFVILSAVVAVSHGLVDLGLSDAGVRKISAYLEHQPGTAVSIGQVFFWIRNGVVVAFLGVVAFLLTPLAQLFNLDGREVALALAFLGILGTTLSGSVNAILQAARRFGRISFLVLTNGLLTLVLAVILGVSHRLTLESALLGLGLATSLTTFAVGAKLLLRPWTILPPTGDELRQYAPALLRFGRWLWIGNFLAVIASRLDILLVQQWSTPSVVGAYALAASLTSKADILNSTLITVLLPSVSALKGQQQLRSFLRRGLVSGSVISLGLIALIPLAGPLILAFYGPEYSATVEFVRWLLVIVAFDVMVAPLLLLAYPLDKPQLLAQGDGLRIAVLLILGVVLIPLIGPTGVILAKLCASVSGASLSIFRLYRLSAGVQWTTTGEKEDD